MSVDRNNYLSDVWKDSIFANKVVFCTGGGGTICSAQVRALVHLGANACILGRNEEKTRAMAQDIERVRRGSKVLPIVVDVRDADKMAAAAKTCNTKLGSIDFVIAGAAGNFLASINQLSPNAFKSVIDIDVLGSYNTVKATLPYLLVSAAAHRNLSGDSHPNGTGGRIVFISATLHYAGQPMQAHVMAAKAGVDALNTSVAIEQGPRGITSNVIAPGGIADTEGLSRLTKKGQDPIRNKFIPAGRFGTVRDIADATIYLFSTAGSYVNGEILVVDGGAWHMPHTQAGFDWEYPDFLLNDEHAMDVKGKKKAKI